MSADQNEVSQSAVVADFVDIIVTTGPVRQPGQERQCRGISAGYPIIRWRGPLRRDQFTFPLRGDYFPEGRAAVEISL